jgi:predicted dehydrogenase
MVRMQRRQFLSAALAAAAAPMRGAGKPIRTAFLGASHSHTRGKLEVVKTSAEFALAGVWDEDQLVRAQFAKRGETVLTLEQILGDKAIDAVVVQSDTIDHARHAALALEAGKHVHIEKPPSLDVAAFRNMLDMAARKKLVFQQGYMWRHHPGFRRIAEAVRGGWLGEVYMVEAKINKTLEPERRPEWARFRGGQMFELGSHIIDQMVLLMGRPDRITPYLKKHGAFPDNLTDNTIAVFEFPRALGVVIGSALDPNGSRYRSFVVSGSNGTATMAPIEPPQLTFDLMRAAGPYQKGVQTVELPKYRRFADDFVEFAAAIRGEAPLLVTPHEDLVVQECIIEASGM